MNIEIRSSQEIEAMRRAGSVAAATLQAVSQALRPGMRTADIDALVREDTRQRGATPSQLGYHGFPAAVCTSRNEVVCHGIPSVDEVLLPGDIVNVDITSCLDGWHGDTSATFTLGPVDPDSARLVEAARQARDAGIAAIRHGARLGDIGAAVEEIARGAGLSVVREYGGHGIGRRMHCPPHVSHFGPGGIGPRLKAGMVLTVEPMLNLGGPAIRKRPDGWTIVTADGRRSAQFEHTVLVTTTGYEVLTAPPG